MRNVRLPLVFTALLAATSAALPAIAQDRPDGIGGPGMNGGGPGGGPMGGRMRGGPPSVHQMMSHLQEEMDVSDDDWKSLEPKIEKVVTLKRDLDQGGGGPGGMKGGGFGRRNGGQGGGAAAHQAADANGGDNNGPPGDGPDAMNGGGGPGDHDGPPPGGTDDRGGPRSDGGPTSRPAPSELRLAMHDLHEAAEDDQAPEDDLATKMAAVRAARAKTKAAYEAAEADLKPLLKPRQEAILLSMNVIE